MFLHILNVGVYLLMPSLLHNIPSWVGSAPAGEVNFRRAVHVVLHAVATSPALSRTLCMKGGILMALHYESERHTTDIDFSTPEPFSEEAEGNFRDAFEKALAIAPEALGYSLELRMQSFRVDPGRDKTYVTLRLTVGYAEKGTPIHKRLLAGHCPHVVGLDYSFLESIPELEKIDIDEDGTIQVYGLSTLFAEKLRALLQQPIRGRTRRQDIYDLSYLLRSQPALSSPETKSGVLGTLKKKCAERQIDAKIDTFRDPEIKSRAAKEYDTLAEELPAGTLPPFDESYSAVANYYESLPWDEI